MGYHDGTLLIVQMNALANFSTGQEGQALYECYPDNFLVSKPVQM